MKNNRIPTLKLLIFSLTIGIYFSSCHKDEVSPMTNSGHEASSNLSSNASYLGLSSAQYASISDELSKDFEKIQLIENNEQLISDENLSFYLFSYDKMIAKQKAILNKYPVLHNFESILDIYHKALLLDDSKKEAFVRKYSNFLAYSKEPSLVMLKLPRHKAALLNSKGLIKLDDQIIQFTSKFIKIITDGDANKIELLDNTSKTTESISVQELTINNNKRTDYSIGFIVHPSIPSLKLGFIRYYDFDYTLKYHACHGGGCSYFYVHDVIMGTEVATFFNNSPVVASAFNLLTNGNCNTSCQPSSGNQSFGATNVGIGYTIVGSPVTCEGPYLPLQPVVYPTMLSTPTQVTGFAFTFPSSLFWNGNF